MTPIVAHHRPCVRCGLIARLDRAGYCKLCQYEMAYQKPYIDWKAFTGLWAARGWTWGEAQRV
jgi:hypothetical protein